MLSRASATRLNRYVTYRVTKPLQVNDVADNHYGDIASERSNQRSRLLERYQED